MGLGSLLFGYWLGKSSEERKRKRRRRARLVMRGIGVVGFGMYRGARGTYRIARQRLS